MPTESIEDVLSRFDAYTQTVGVFPEDVKEGLRDIAPFYGVQRFVPLGYSSEHTWCAPHDGIELEPIPGPPSQLGSKHWSLARREKLLALLDGDDMKFSHSIQFNAVPDWSSHYIAYSNLKKLSVPSTHP